jgi:hypothetical protein
MEMIDRKRRQRWLAASAYQMGRIGIACSAKASHL